MKKEAQLVVTGCLPDYDPHSLSKYDVSFSFGARKYDNFLEYFGFKQGTEEYAGSIESEYLGVYNLFNWLSRIVKFASRLHLPLPQYLYRRAAFIEDRDTVYIRISRGCKEFCTYCATRFAIGPLLSNPADMILANFDRHLKSGQRIFALCAEDTGAYGQDVGLDFPTLLAQLLRRKEDFLINIRQHTPHWIIGNLEAYLKVFSDKRVKSITLPFQSGSDRILKLMGRRYNAQELIKTVKAIRKHAPHLMLRTHVIVGFPTETEEDFRKTLVLVKELPWDMVLAFPYTDRSRTEAAKINGKIPWAVALRRCATLSINVLWKIYLNKANIWPLVLRNPDDATGDRI